MKPIGAEAFFADSRNWRNLRCGCARTQTVASPDTTQPGRRQITVLCHLALMRGSPVCRRRPQAHTPIGGAAFLPDSAHDKAGFTGAPPAVLRWPHHCVLEVDTVCVDLDSFRQDVQAQARFLAALKHKSLF